MDIKAMIEKVISEVKKDPKLFEEFKKEPEKTAEKILGVELPDGLVEKAAAALKDEGGSLEKMLEGVKDKVDGEKIGEAFDALKKML